MTVRDKIDESEVFLVLGTENYVRSLRDPEDVDHHMITEQIIIARHLCKPFVLLIDTYMDEKDKDYLRDYFKGFKIVEELPFNSSGADVYLKKSVTILLKYITKGRDI